MPQQLIGVGANADDGNGDTLRDAGIKINDNFTELYTRLQALENRKFGKYVYNAQSLGVSTNTTSTVFPDKLVFDTSTADTGSSTVIPPAGNYHLIVAYSFNCDSTTSDAVIFVEQDGVGMLYADPDGEHRQELQDAGGTFGATGTNQKLPVGRRYPVTLDGSGHPTFRLKYAPSADGVECSIWGVVAMLVSVDE